MSGRVVLLNGASSSGKSSIGQALLDCLPDPWFLMDYPISERWRLDDLLAVLDGYDVTLVEVRCSPEELARRERARGDRPVGLAQSQKAVYELGDRDIVVDTTRATPAACAAHIAEALDTLMGPKAFDRLRRPA